MSIFIFTWQTAIALHFGLFYIWLDSAMVYLIFCWGESGCKADSGGNSSKGERGALRGRERGFRKRSALGRAGVGTMVVGIMDWVYISPSAYSSVLGVVLRAPQPQIIATNLRERSTLPAFSGSIYPIKVQSSCFAEGNTIYIFLQQPEWIES